MRCQCCNKNLSDYEATLRHPETKEFLDICNKCLVDIPIVPIEGVMSENTEYHDDFDVIDEDDYENDPLFLDDN